jgi:putative molybdopterin biosynthesis protein
MSDASYLTTSEAAAYLRLKQRTIYDLVARGAIPCSRATGKLIFPRRLLDRWMESHVEFRSPQIAAPPPIMSGSSDPLLDWALRASGSGIAGLFEGSEAGLERLFEGKALAAGLHIMNDGPGYNTQAVEKVAPFCDLVLICFAKREQGIVVARGNPLGIASLADLARLRPRLVMRQPGSGSQRLFERLLADAGLRPDDLNMSAQPALGETDVAAEVADGRADCGLAIGAVAKRFGLDFIPLATERFDVACRRRDYFEPPLQSLFRLARTVEFAKTAARLGHYDVADTGTVQFNA